MNKTNRVGERKRADRIVGKKGAKQAGKSQFDYYEDFEDFDEWFVDGMNNRKNSGKLDINKSETKKGKTQEKNSCKSYDKSREMSHGKNTVKSSEKSQGKSHDINHEKSREKKSEVSGEKKRKISYDISRGKSQDTSLRRNSTSTVAKGGCPHLKECGSCNLMQTSYEKHLEEKQKQVTSLIGKFCKVEPIIGMKEPRHYRNKVHVVFDHDRKGNPISGIYEEGTHHVIPIDQCLIHNEKADEIINTIKGMLKSFKIRTYDEDTGYGLLRHVLIRTGFRSGEIMVVLVLSSPILPSKNNFVKALRKEHPEITTVVINVNDKKTSMVLGEKEHVIYGKGYIEDTLCDKIFRISPKSFYQVNPAQTEILYKKAIELAGFTGNETVIDAYCGIGTIGLIASDHVKRVIGVELNKDAVRDAVINAKRNGAKNVEFYNNDAGVFMTQVAEKNESIDFVFMDPPRSGSTEQFLDAIATLKPKKVVYISCNPVTLERDLSYLTKKGYKAKVAVPVDMFPWTEHVECVVLITKL